MQTELVTFSLLRSGQPLTQDGLELVPGVAARVCQTGFLQKAGNFGLDFRIGGPHRQPDWPEVWVVSGLQLWIDVAEQMLGLTNERNTNDS